MGKIRKKCHQKDGSFDGTFAPTGRDMPLACNGCNPLNNSILHTIYRGAILCARPSQSTAADVSSAMNGYADAGHPFGDGMCVGRYEMNTERSGGFIEMPVTDAAHLDACRRYATPAKAFLAFHKWRVIVIVQSGISLVSLTPQFHAIANALTSIPHPLFGNLAAILFGSLAVNCNVLHFFGAKVLTRAS